MILGRKARKNVEKFCEAWQGKVELREMRRIPASASILERTREKVEEKAELEEV